MISDKTRYSTDSPDEDFPGLGENPNLKALNTRLIKAQLTFLDDRSPIDRERAARALLERVAEYYEVVGYVGPYPRRRSDIGMALGGWRVELGIPWRERWLATDIYCWGTTPDKIFRRTRYMCFESALRLAVYEFSQVVPDSAQALRQASWAAKNALMSGFSNWRAIRNRYGSKRMRRYVADRVVAVRSMTFVATEFSGYFVAGKAHDQDGNHRDI